MDKSIVLHGIDEKNKWHVTTYVSYVLRQSLYVVTESIIQILQEQSPLHISNEIAKKQSIHCTQLMDVYYTHEYTKVSRRPSVIIIMASAFAS